jgi:hypothetical protein
MKIVILISILMMGCSVHGISPCEFDQHQGPGGQNVCNGSSE